ncbi:unnamed protein product, partial [Durusdinium trenchii]
FTGDQLACADGYHGDALQRCVAQLLPGSNDTCVAVGDFTGCAPISPCRAPDIAATDCELT